LFRETQIKLSVVASGIFGVSGRDMMAALIAGQRDPKILAQLARQRLRAKISLLEEAFTGYFSGHHAFLLQRMLARVDAIISDIAALDTRIEEITPFSTAVRKLDEVPGINLAAAHAILAKTGLDGPVHDRAPAVHEPVVPDRRRVPVRPAYLRTVR
jgi:transposase